MNLLRHFAAVTLVLAFCFMSSYSFVISAGKQCYHVNPQLRRMKRPMSCASLRVKRLEVTEFISKWADLCVETISEAHSLEPLLLPSALAQRSGQIGKQQTVSIEVDAHRNELLRYVRVVKLSGAEYNVLNFVALPHAAYDLPIFGADLVFLPGKLYMH